MARVSEYAAAADMGGEAGTGSDRPVDLVHLARYTMGNRDLEQEVLSLFAKQSVIYLDRLRQAADERTWQEAAHTLKGSARGIGAWQIAEFVVAVEELSFASTKNDKAGKIEELARSVDEANAFIVDLLQDAAA